ncbi:hypothetical protein BASA61_007865 [Batrachochytrium salamandrivorans]|nr:hypothetical protein BASA61_007865 [Batrachochytrium salamandrivorans]
MGFTSLFSCFKPLATSKISTKSVYEWTPLDEETPTPTSDQDPVDIGLSYILQQLNIQPDEFTRRTNFTDQSTVKISSEDAVKAAVDCLGVPFYHDIAPVKESYETDNGNILVWSFQLRDNPTTQWIEVKVDMQTLPGVLNLHIFTATNPNRDPALDNTIMTHELTHGVSERLTGGAQTKMCMTKIESRGLSEGYSDMIALIFTAKPEDTRNTKK